MNNKITYGDNYKTLKKLYVNRKNSGLQDFITEVLDPSSTVKNNIAEISDDVAWDITLKHFIKWVYKRRFENWQEVYTFVTYNYQYDDYIFTPKTDSTGKRINHYFVNDMESRTNDEI